MDPKGRPSRALGSSSLKEGKSRTLGAPVAKGDKATAGSTTPGRVAPGTPNISPRLSGTRGSNDLGSTIGSLTSVDDEAGLKAPPSPRQSDAASDSPLSPMPSAESSASGNVKVCVRFRPQNSVEKDASGFWVVEAAEDHKNIKVKDPQIFQAQSFSFDRVFMPESTQQSVYDFVGRPLVTDVLNGYNCSLMAYGQTGSGKTHTMMGEDGELQGIIPRLLDDVFSCMESAPPSIEFSIRVSYVEIYLERICDLLNPESTDLKVREDVVRGLYLEGVEELYVASREEIRELMQRGSANRSVASTRMNADSSRSHSVFILSAEQVDSNQGLRKCGRMYLVDLAGSETVSKTNASGQTLQEAKMINKSLSALGNVIKALTERQSHIPYRDSKLTRLLQDALGGNSKTSLVIACSGSSYNVTETLSTLRFGTRAKAIRNKPRVNQERSLEEYKRLLEGAETKEKDLLSIIKRLEDQVRDLLGKVGDTKGKAGDTKGGKSRMEELEEDGGGVGELIAAELSTMFMVLQPIALEIRDELKGGSGAEMDAALKLLTQADEEKNTPILSSGMIRLFQIVKEVLDEKRRSLDKATSAVRSLEGVLADKDATIAEKDAIIAEKLAVIAEKDASIAETGGLLTELERRSAVAEKEVTGAGNNATVAALQAQIDELRNNSDKAAEKLHEERKRGALLEERVREVEASLNSKDYEIQEKELEVEQLRSTLDTIMVTIPTASIVTSVVSSPRGGRKPVGPRLEGGFAEVSKEEEATQRAAALENDLRDLSGQWVSMRTKFEEQRAAVEQLKETLNDMQGSDGKARIADTILDLTQKLDEKSNELQQQGIAVQSLMYSKAKMEKQMTNRDERIKQLEVAVAGLRGRVKEDITNHNMGDAPLGTGAEIDLKKHFHVDSSSSSEDEGSPSPPSSSRPSAASRAAAHMMMGSPMTSPSKGNGSWLSSPSASEWMSSMFKGPSAQNPASSASGAGKTAAPFGGANIRKVIRGRGKSVEEEDA